MKITTIQLSKETRDKVVSFGMKGESYDVVMRRICLLAMKEQLRNFLMSSGDAISIEDARKELDEEWPR